MPIASTIIAAGLAAGGAALSASSQKKAASKAADTSLQVAEQNNALARDIYGQNKQTLDPYVQRGNAAGNQINALLGLGGTPAQTTSQPNALYQGFNPDTSGGVFGRPQLDNRLQQAQVRDDPIGSNVRTATGVPATGTPATGTPAPAGQTAQQAANNAFDIFKNSTGYQFRLGEGMRAVNGGYAGAGTLQSGAALKAINEYGQNFASNEFGNYMGYLGNQQGTGLSGASALAGVSQNYANSVMNNNNNAGNAAANAALIRGQNNPFANALGTIGGTILGGGFGR